jgi:hypothetical protein
MKQIDIQMRSFRLKGDNRTLFCTEAKCDNNLKLFQIRQRCNLKPIYNYVLTASLNDFGPAKITIGEYKRGKLIQYCVVHVSLKEIKK